MMGWVPGDEVDGVGAEAVAVAREGALEGAAKMMLLEVMVAGTAVWEGEALSVAMGGSAARGWRFGGLVGVGRDSESGRRLWVGFGWGTL